MPSIVFDPKGYVFLLPLDEALDYIEQNPILFADDVEDWLGFNIDQIHEDNFNDAVADGYVVNTFRNFCHLLRGYQKLGVYPTLAQFINYYSGNYTGSFYTFIKRLYEWTCSTVSDNLSFQDYLFGNFSQTTTTINTQQVTSVSLYGVDYDTLLFPLGQNSQSVQNALTDEFYTVFADFTSDWDGYPNDVLHVTTAGSLAAGSPPVDLSHPNMLSAVNPGQYFIGNSPSIYGDGRRDGYLSSNLIGSLTISFWYYIDLPNDFLTYNDIQLTYNGEDLFYQAQDLPQTDKTALAQPVTNNDLTYNFPGMYGKEILEPGILYPQTGVLLALYGTPFWIAGEPDSSNEYVLKLYHSSRWDNGSDYTGWAVNIPVTFNKPTFYAITLSWSYSGSSDPYTVDYNIKVYVDREEKIDTTKTFNGAESDSGYTLKNLEITRLPYSYITRLGLHSAVLTQDEVTHLYQVSGYHFRNDPAGYNYII